MSLRQIRKSFVKQHDISDCGIACLVSIMNFFGGSVSFERLRMVSGTSQRGTTLLGIYKAAESVGLVAQGIKKASIRDLSNFTEPVILHVVNEDLRHHYVVYYGLRAGRFIIGDPSSGIRLCDEEYLQTLWRSGTLLKLTPTKDFVKVRKRSQTFSWIKQLIAKDLNILFVAVFLGLVISLLNLATYVLTEKLIDSLIPSGDVPKVITSVLLVLFLLLFKILLSYKRSLLLINQLKVFNINLNSSFLSALFSLPKPFFDSRKIGEIIGRLDDIKRIQQIVMLIAGTYVVDFLIVAIALIGLVFYNVNLFLFVCLNVIVTVISILKFRHSIGSKAREVMVYFSKSQGLFAEILKSFETVRSYHKESFFRDRVDRSFIQYQQKVFEASSINAHFTWQLELVNSVFILSTFLMTSLLTISAAITLGEMVAIITLVTLITNSLNRVVLSTPAIQEIIIASERVIDLVNIQKPQMRYSINSPFQIFDLKIDNVTFGFPGRNKLLNGLTLNISDGEMIGLTGPSGSGKTTVLALLQRFYLPTSGQILLSGHDLETLPTEILNGKIAVVKQDPDIINGSLLFNISLSDEVEAHKKAIKLLVELNFSHYFSALPDGLGSILGDDGTKLSGGQRQLVGLARALYRESKVLLLDEPTSSMDEHLENFCKGVLKLIRKDKLILIISHKKEILRLADRVLMLSNGQLQPVEVD